MISPFLRFTKVYEILTPEKRGATDQQRTRNGLASSQDLTRIYIYIYTVRSSATDTTKAHKGGLHSSQYRPTFEPTRPPRPPCGSRPARDAGQPTRAPHFVTAGGLQRAGSLRVTRNSSAKLLRCYMTAEAPPCYKTDISKM